MGTGVELGSVGAPTALSVPPALPQHPREHLLSGLFSPGCDLSVWRLQENEVAFFKVPKRQRRSFTLLLGLSSRGFGVFGSKVRLLQSSPCICFLCLCVWHSLLPQFADFVTMAFKLPLERTAAVRGALTCVGREEKCFKTGGSAAFYTKIAPGSFAPWPWTQPCPKEPPGSPGNSRERGDSGDKCPCCPSSTSGLVCPQFDAVPNGPGGTRSGDKAAAGS